MIRAFNFRERRSNTLVGFVDLALEPSGITLHHCTVHQGQDGQQWIGLPGRPQLDKEGRQRRDPGTGKALYVPSVSIPEKQARERFQRAAIEAVRALLASAQSGVAA
jgi:hypothetical protein